jgi:hypothetical protein
MTPEPQLGSGVMRLSGSIQTLPQILPPFPNAPSGLAAFAATLSHLEPVRRLSVPSAGGFEENPQDVREGLKKIGRM